MLSAASVKDPTSRLLVLSLRKLLESCQIGLCFLCEFEVSLEQFVRPLSILGECEVSGLSLNICSSHSLWEVSGSAKFLSLLPV